MAVAVVGGRFVAGVDYGSVDGECCDSEEGGWRRLESPYVVVGGVF